MDYLKECTASFCRVKINSGFVVSYVVYSSSLKIEAECSFKMLVTSSTLCDITSQKVLFFQIVNSEPQFQITGELISFIRYCFKSLCLFSSAEYVHPEKCCKSSSLACWSHLD
jgi:hypothetical protein